MTKEKTSLAFSNRWFRNFQKRHGIGLQKRYGDAQKINIFEYEDDIQKIKDILSNYHVEYIYNLDEVSLFIVIWEINFVDQQF